MPAAPYRVVFYSETEQSRGLPMRQPVATMTLDDAASREAAVELAIMRFRSAYPEVFWIDAPPGTTGA